MEDHICSPPCKRLRPNQISDNLFDEKIRERVSTSSQPATPSQYESNINLVEPRMIVLALTAPPTQQIIENNKRQTKNLDHRRRLRHSASGTTTAVSVFKISNLSRRCSWNRVLVENGRLKLSGCAVISKGVLVVEGEISCIKRFLKLMVGREYDKSNFVKVIWEGKVAKKRFGKFSILRRSSSEVSISNFFADHGASHYWDRILLFRSK